MLETSDPVDGIDATRLNHSLTRRRFLSQLGLLSAGAAAGPALLACTQQGSSSSSSSSDWAKAPVTFVFAVDGDADVIDPHGVFDFESFQVTRNVYDPLVQVDDAALKLVPWLATSWDVSADGLTHTFHLRQGVTFHDGSKLDAQTVKMNFDRLLDMKKGPYYVVSNVTKVAVVDPMTVAITTDGPDSYLPAHLVKVGIVSSQAITQHRTASDPWATQFFQDNAVGSGPYKLDQWQKGVQMNLVKNEKWWSPWRPGSIDKVIIKPTADVAARIQLFQTGGADFINLWPASEAIRVGKMAHRKLLEFNTFDTDPIFYLNTQRPPFDKKEVRQAMQYAFDYNAMHDYYKGFATIPTGPMPPDFPGAAQDLQPFKQDLTKAKALLQQAGVSPSSVNPNCLVVTGVAEFSVAATIMQDSLKKLGANLTITEIPSTQLISRYSNPASAGDMTPIIASPFTLDPLIFMAFFRPDNTFNLAKFNDPSVTAQLDKAAKTADSATQKQILHDVQHYVRDQAPCVWGARPKTLVVIPDYLDGYVMQATDYRWTVRFDNLRVRAH
ncbi:ABC transporter substrate-binding protein [Candidatus Nephthysia bennettiae]|uniref:ABC transporter substrate-binding protein n=1 Tax=Candidatus Nephthysia bennettiae TaxID=3127016 RepID=A0A934NAA5_9BACT|nr:ABC transporter substrate-binding protein [Candidatus Dormibacteraeota bacterium]MBJ7612977.1 ABC transporter substrate-binding protein [Candidatus Dormibacteraeota bacterium]